MARAQVRHKLETRGIMPEDLARDQGPVLVHTRAPTYDYVDAVTDAGLLALGLPAAYPLDRHEEPVGREVCQPIGQRAWDASEPGIACRSAAAIAPPNGEELALFARRRHLRVVAVEAYADWYWGGRSATHASRFSTSSL